MKERFLRFALAVYCLTKKFPKETVYFVIERQLLKCSSSSAANYNAVCRGRTRPDFINKLRVVEEELDETLFWFKYTCGIDKRWISETLPLESEGDELISIIVASIKTALKNS